MHVPIWNAAGCSVRYFWVWQLRCCCWLASRLIGRYFWLPERWPEDREIATISATSFLQESLRAELVKSCVCRSIQTSCFWRDRWRKFWVIPSRLRRKYFLWDYRYRRPGILWFPNFCGGCWSTDWWDRTILTLCRFCRRLFSERLFRWQRRTFWLF